MLTVWPLQPQHRQHQHPPPHSIWPSYTPRPSPLTLPAPIPAWPLPHSTISMPPPAPQQPQSTRRSQSSTISQPHHKLSPLPSGASSARSTPTGPASARVSLSSRHLASSRKERYLRSVRDQRDSTRFESREADLGRLDRARWLEERARWEAGLLGSAPVLPEQEEEEQVVEMHGGDGAGRAVMSSGGWAERGERGWSTGVEEAEAEAVLRAEAEALEALIGMMPEEEGQQGEKQRGVFHQEVVWQGGGDNGAGLEQQQQQQQQRRESSHFGSDDEDMELLFADMLGGDDEMDIDS